MSETATLNAFQRSVAELAEAELGPLTERRDKLAGELAEVNAELRSIQKIMATVNPKPVAKKQAKKNGHAATAIIPEKRRQAIEFITGNTDEITTTKVREALNTSGSYANMICKELRDEGLLRLAATQGSLMVYRSTV
jgi:cell pole-organizing protein PopZ